MSRLDAIGPKPTAQEVADLLGCDVQRVVDLVEHLFFATNASQPKKAASPTGWVYFLRSGHLVKVGWTTKLEERIAAHVSSNPGVVFLTAVRGTQSDESAMHRRFQRLRVHKRREWFHFEGELQEFVAGQNN